MGGAILSAVVGAIFGGLAGALAGWLATRRRGSTVGESTEIAPDRPEPGAPVQTALPLENSQLTTAMKASQSVLDELERRYAGAQAEDEPEARSRGALKRRPPKASGRAPPRAR